MNEEKITTRETVMNMAPVTSVNEQTVARGDSLTKETTITTRRTQRMIRERIRINEDG